MDYIPSETMRGHLDTIILLSLVDSDKHSNQIKDFIEERSGGQFVLKQGTFYSCLQRITKQGFVTEYRTTDEDGVRRKFFQLTEKGKTYIDDNKDNWAISKHVLDMLISSDKKSEDKPAGEPSGVSRIPANDDPVQFVATEVSPVESSEYEEDTLKNFLSDRINGEPSDDLKERDLSYIDFTQAEVLFSTPVSDKSTTTDARAVSDNKAFEQLSIDDAPAAFEEIKKPERSHAEPANHGNFAASEPKEILSPEKADNEPLFSTRQPPAQKTIYDLSDNVEAERAIDYKSVLETIFAGQGSAGKKSARELKYEAGVDVNDFFSSDEKPKKDEPVEIPRDSVKSDKKESSHERKIKKLKILKNETREPAAPAAKENSFYDFSDIIDLAGEEGFKIRISSKDNKKDVGKILINKLNLYNSLFFFLMIFVETLVLAIATRKVAELTFVPFLLFVGANAFLPLVNGVVYLIEPSRKVRTLPSFKNSIELILIICLNLLLIDIVCCVLGAVDFSSYKELTRYIFYPILFIIDLPMYVIIRHLSLQKNKFYE